MGQKRIRADLKERYECFAAAYIANGNNARAAALAAGYTEASATTKGHRMVHSPYVQQLLQDHKERVAAELEATYAITRENVLDALSNLVFGTPQKLFDQAGNMLPVSALDDRTARMISSFEVEEFRDRETGEIKTVTKKVKLWCKNSAIDKAMRHLGLFEKDNNQKPATVTITRDDAGVL